MRPAPSLLLCLALLVAPVCQAAPPNVAIVYNPTLDALCALATGHEIKDEWKAELVARKPEFDELWRTLGPKWIAAAEVITGKSFPSGQITARLSLCSVPSQSIVGVSLNMRYALAAFHSPPVTLRYKVVTLFHELLHVYLTRHPVRDSPLLREHGSASRCVRNHLHLLALMKAVFLQLGELAALDEEIAGAQGLPDDCYAQAWSLVNASEMEYLRYVAEIAR